MTRPELTAFGAGHIERAAELCAARYATLRRNEPLLGTRFGDAGAWQELIAQRLDDGARGVAAVKGDDLLGYVCAVVGDDSSRGHHAWISPELWAAAPSRHDLVRDLYGEVARRWTELGVAHHYVMVPDDPICLEPWLGSGFAFEQVHAIRSTSAVDTRGDADLMVDEATEEDLDALSPLFDLIGRAHESAPTMAFVDDAFYEDLVPGHRELLADGSVGYFKARRGDQMLGFCVFVPVGEERSSLLAPSGSVELLVAATAPSARGAGVMSALVSRGLEWAGSNGFDVCVTDWRMANLESSRFWPARGFKAVAHRMHRIVDPRLLPG